MMSKTPATGELVAYTGVFRDANWWLFCLLILALNFLLLAFDPLPKLFMGDSAGYLWTAFSGLPPPDRSFLYGYVIRWSSLWTGSLTSLLILQAFFGASHGDFSCTCLPMDFRTGLSRVLSFWTSMFARSIAIGLAALRYDRND